jgi:hypothetical protein
VGDVTKTKETTMFKKLSILAAAGAFAAVLASPAQALTPASLSSIAIENAAADIIQVREGCGRGWHRNWRGRCVPNVRRHVGPRRVCRTVWRGNVRRTVCRTR